MPPPRTARRKSCRAPSTAGCIATPTPMRGRGPSAWPRRCWRWVCRAAIAWDPWLGTRTIISSCSTACLAPALCSTSGTLGVPKGVVTSHRSTLLSALIMSTAAMIGGYRSGAREVVMPIAPLFHGNGWQMVYTAPMNGHKLVLPGRNFEPDKLYELMAAEQATLAPAVPTVWLTLLDYMDSKGLRFRSLRAALVAGSQPPRALVEALEGRHGVDVAQCSGMTEP